MTPSPEPIKKEFLTYAEVAARLGVHKETVKRWAHKRKFEVTKFSHKCRLVKASVVEDFITRRTKLAVKGR